MAPVRAVPARPFSKLHHGVLRRVALFAVPLTLSVCVLLAFAPPDMPGRVLPPPHEDMGFRVALVDAGTYELPHVSPVPGLVSLDLERLAHTVDPVAVRTAVRLYPAPEPPCCGGGADRGAPEPIGESFSDPIFLPAGVRLVDRVPLVLPASPGTYLLTAELEIEVGEGESVRWHGVAGDAGVVVVAE